MGRRAVEIARSTDPSIVTNLLADLAEAYMGLADHQKAAECFAEARRVLAQQSDEGDEPSYSAQLGVMVAEGRVALRRGALDEAIAVLQAALDMSERTDAKEYELEINDLLATAFKRSGRFEEALERREQHDDQYRRIFTHAADLRLRTLQVAHETATRACRGRDPPPPHAGARADPRDADSDEPRLPARHGDGPCTSRRSSSSPS